MVPGKRWVPTLALGAVLFPVDQTRAWFLGAGHLPSCAYICLDRLMSQQSSCQDLKCICNSPALLSSAEVCFRKECDLDSLSRALKLLATCQESFGTTPPASRLTPGSPSYSTPSPPPPATPYANNPYGYGYAPPVSKPADPLPYYPYDRTFIPPNTTVYGATPRPVAPVASAPAVGPSGSPPSSSSFVTPQPPAPAPAPAPVAATAPVPSPAPAPASAPESIAGNSSVPTNSSSAPPATSTPLPLFPTGSKPSAGDAAYSQGSNAFAVPNISMLLIFACASTMARLFI